MTWNTPETVPKDDLILGVFDDYHIPTLAAWNEDTQDWAIASHQIEIHPAYPENNYWETESAKKLLGWMPLPPMPEVKG